MALVNRTEARNSVAGIWILVLARSARALSGGGTSPPRTLVYDAVDLRDVMSRTALRGDFPATAGFDGVWAMPGFEEGSKDFTAVVLA